MERVEKLEGQKKIIEQKIEDEQKILEAGEKLAAIFQGRTELRITHSSEDLPRVRAIIPDDDADLAYIEMTMLVGAAQIEHEGQPKYLVESYFPYSQTKRRYFWEFTPNTNELIVKIVQVGQDVEQLDLPLAASSRQINYFSAQIRDLQNAPRMFDYENRWKSDVYEFELPQLQDNDGEIAVTPGE